MTLLDSLNSKEKFIEFAQKYGYITDEDLAIELLCKTPFAWYALDDELKNNPKVIMYYQPIGNIICYYELTPYWLPIKNEESEICLLDNNDKIDHTELSQEGFGSTLDVLDTHDCQMPKIEYPKGFDITLYCNIQRSLKTTSKKLEEIDLDFIKSFDPNNVKKRISCVKTKGYTFYKYDRKKLASIVDEEIKKLNKNNKQISHI